MAYTTSEFISNVKTRVAMPTSQNTYTEAKILLAGDSELRSFILPLVMKAQEGFYSYDVDTAITSDGVYYIHSRAVGSMLINAALIDGNTRLDLNWLTEDELERLDQSNYGKPGIYVKRMQLQLIPATAHGFSTFRQTIALRPGTLVATSAAAQITAISGATLTFATGTIPATFTTSQTFDFIQANPHFDHVSIDNTATTITSTTMVFSASVPSRLAVGDWVSLSSQSPIVQVPLELYPLHEQATANYLLRAQGDLEVLKAGEEHLGRMMKNTTPLYTPRIQKEGKKILPKSGLFRRF